MNRIRLQERLNSLDINQRLNVSNLKPDGTGTTKIIPKSNRWLKSKENENLIANLSNPDQLKLAMKILHFEDTTILRIDEPHEQFKLLEKYTIQSANYQVYYLIINQIIFKNILEYLPEYQILELENDPHFKKMCSEFLKNHPKRKIVNNLNALDSNVKNIHINNSDIQVNALIKFTQLESLTVFISGGSYEDNVAIVKQLNKMTTLKSVNLIFGLFEDNKMRLLKTLKVDHLTSITLYATPDEELLSKLTNISTLVLSWVKLTSAIIKHLETLQKLTTLDITLNWENATLSEDISNLVNLKDLRIRNLELFKRALKLNKLNKLDSLTLSGSHSNIYFEGINIRQLTIEYSQLSLNHYETISEMSRLRHLTISNNYVTDANFKPITQMTDLEKLTVNRGLLTKFTFENAEWPKLYYLHVPNNRLSGNVTIFSKFKCLKYLNISGNRNLKFDGISKFKNLIQLELKYANLAYDNFQEIFTLTKLRSLNIEYTTNIIGNFNGIQNLINLRYLNIDHRSYLTNWTHIELEWLLHLWDLETLIIDLSNCTDKMVTILSKMPNLRRLRTTRLPKSKSEQLLNATKLEYFNF